MQFVKKFAFVGVLALASTAFAADQNGISPEERMSLETSPAVVYIRALFKVAMVPPCAPSKSAGTLGATGTGFLYRPDGYIITNAHVVELANIKDAGAQAARSDMAIDEVEKVLRTKLSDRDREAARHCVATGAPQLEVYLNNHRMYTGEIKVYSDPSFVNNGKDVAIIKIDGNNLPTVKLGNSDDVHVGEPLMIAGYPGAATFAVSEQSVLVPSFTNGHISAVKVDYKGTPVLQSDAAITHGNSGGPAFDPDGKVIGISTYGNDRDAAGFNFFVPINTALEFVRQAGAEPQSGEFDKTWSAALEAYAKGDWESAHRLFGDVLGMMPDLPDAIRLENVAARNERNETPVDRLLHGGGMLLWAAVGAVVVILIAIFIWRMAASSSRKPALAMAGMPSSAAVAATPSMAAPSATPPVAPAPRPEQTFGFLQVTSGPLNGNRFPITKAGLLIGRDSAKCNIVISDETVSKEHAWVVPLDSEVVVIDRGSSNGTYVNSIDSPRVNKVPLKSGDRVFIGKKGAAVLTFQSA